MHENRFVLLAAALIIGIATFGPSQDQEVDWCWQCDHSGDCFACCRCGGGGAGSCLMLCGPSASTSETEAMLMSEDEGEIRACTANEAPSPGGAAPTEVPGAPEEVAPEEVP